MSTHVTVLYTVAVGCYGGWYEQRECYFDGEAKSVEWDGSVLKIGRKKIYASEWFSDCGEIGDQYEWELSQEPDWRAREGMKYRNLIARMTDIQYLKIGDTVLRDIRDEEKSEEDSDA